jgi:hypothetical protein
MVRAPSFLFRFLGSFSTGDEEAAGNKGTSACTMEGSIGRCCMCFWSLFARYVSYRGPRSGSQRVNNTVFLHRRKKSSSIRLLSVRGNGGLFSAENQTEKHSYFLLTGIEVNFWHSQASNSRRVKFKNSPGLFSPRPERVERVILDLRSFCFISSSFHFLHRFISSSVSFWPRPSSGLRRSFTADERS